MKNEEIAKLVDYVMLNACSVSSTGLYNGKSGFSLCLFEQSRLTENCSNEEHAYELLQESLLTRNPDVGFENGLAGVAYVLAYLIVNGFVEADLDEVFGANLAKVRVEIERMKKNKELYRLLNMAPLIYLLQHHELDKVSWKSYWEALLIQTEEHLLTLFRNPAFFSDFTDAIRLFGNYLQCALLDDPQSINLQLVKNFLFLYKTGHICSNLKIGHYLNIAYSGSHVFDEILKTMKHLAVSNILPDDLTLKERLGFLYLLKK